MRQFAALAFALLISACGDAVDERYGTWHDAKLAGAVERGWVPPFVPMTARNLRSIHDLDTDSQRLTFRLPPQAIQPMIDDIAPLSRLNGDMLQRAINKIGADKGPSTTSAAYMMCTNKFSGAIIVTPETGDVTYVTPAEWGRANCPHPL
jgi:hypothetical protein